jgi:(E)-4-hydroxy-3-methylbut-2-enyl-diphosphate synthase
MTNTSTLDTEASVEQCIRIIEAGADLVRLTAQGIREAANLANIHRALKERGYSTPLSADIHYNPDAALEAARHVEKVRINPGNYVDKITRASVHYAEEDYQAELMKVRARFLPLLGYCKAHHRAIRIGVNHGSLSDRIMSRYGDTPAGMGASRMEFLRWCVEADFTQVVVSMKASNVWTMVQSVRLLVATMKAEHMSFPLHLGVTEAGEGEDGRIKSAVGIGTLLLDGIGDTIRVSLSEDPELEIPVAMKLVEQVNQRTGVVLSEVPELYEAIDPFQLYKRETLKVGPFGGGQSPLVLLDVSLRDPDPPVADNKPDFWFASGRRLEEDYGIPQLCPWPFFQEGMNGFPVGTVDDISLLEQMPVPWYVIRFSYRDLKPGNLEMLARLSKRLFYLNLIYPVWLNPGLFFMPCLGTAVDYR